MVNKVFFERLVDWVLPPLCPLTAELVERQGMMAPSAWAKLNFVAAPFCASCALPLAFDPVPGADLRCGGCLADPPPFAQTRAVFVYDEASRDLILRFKHADQTYMVKTLVPLLAQAGQDYWRDEPVIVPVPLHRWRLLARRYNQSALLAQGIAREKSLTCLPDALLRKRATPSQGHLRQGERERNVKNAFAVNQKHADALKGKSIVLVDDVFTTGATLRECTRTLLDAGLGTVRVLCVARTAKVS